MAVHIRRGLDLSFAGPPRQSIEAGPELDRIAILGADYRGLRFDVLVEAGAQVVAGQPVLRQRNRHERVVVAPVAGEVVAIIQGARRTLATLEIAPGPSKAQAFSLPEQPDRTALVELLHRSGLWAAVRSRPFGGPAELASVPDAVFVTAMDTRPHAPDPAMIVAAHGAWFEAGADALCQLTAGPVFICHAEGKQLPVPAKARAAAFAGRHPAGLPSTHIHQLFPVNRPGRTVWQVGYQDVIALGHLLQTGQLWAERIVAVSGPAISSPTLLRTLPGASLAGLARGRLNGAAALLHSGSPLDGRVQGFLSRSHVQVYAAAPVRHGERNGLGHRLRNWMSAGIPAIIPNGLHERAAPPGVLPIPLLRALSVGDAETAAALGALELVEDDLALLAHVDGNGTDFGTMLRAVLDELEAAA